MFWENVEACFPHIFWTYKRLVWVKLSHDEFQWSVVVSSGGTRKKPTWKYQGLKRHKQCVSAKHKQTSKQTKKQTNKQANKQANKQKASKQASKQKTSKQEKSWNIQVPALFLGFLFKLWDLAAYWFKQWVFLCPSRESRQGVLLGSVEKAGNMKPMTPHGKDSAEE